MRNGILRDDEGFDILIDGIAEPFRDEKANAYIAACELKRSNRNRIIEIRERSTGQKQIMPDTGGWDNEKGRQPRRPLRGIYDCTAARFLDEATTGWDGRARHRSCDRHRAFVLSHWPY
jgi:hypothetical protein